MEFLEKPWNKSGRSRVAARPALLTLIINFLETAIHIANIPEKLNFYWKFLQNEYLLQNNQTSGIVLTQGRGEEMVSLAPVHTKSFCHFCIDSRFSSECCFLYIAESVFILDICVVRSESKKYLFYNFFKIWFGLVVLLLCILWGSVWCGIGFNPSINTSFYLLIFYKLFPS